MRIKLIIISVLFLLFAIIAVQNTISTDLNLLLWKIQIPLIVLITVIFLIAFVIGITIGSVYERRKTKEKKSEIVQNKTEKE